MAVKTHIKGNKFTICFWINEDGECAVENYILELYENNNLDAEAIINLLEKTAKFGLLQNEQKFRHLKGKGQGLVEFKARGGTRLLGFIIEENQVVICTHGVPKLKEKRFNREIIKAQEIKELYLIENLPEENNYVN